jgi:hypothetical protein
MLHITAVVNLVLCRTDKPGLNMGSKGQPNVRMTKVGTEDVEGKPKDVDPKDIKAAEYRPVLGHPLESAPHAQRRSGFDEFRGHRVAKVAKLRLGDTRAVGCLRQALLPKMVVAPGR